ncbi:hypothetical protein MC7420_1305 [Coleofasciculus chthonoplastes PCC 7420]|uniref:Uncharacterized protein n=1 Tax=Coleofasciculus chthonoplastes PCC 7420 TaxID=118168 RepID=B4VRH9_9CYAN|nr:hypothetical protein MC7420_1305 [Coleofasciculus chthonoplastes PCC 7420]
MSSRGRIDHQANVELIELDLGEQEAITLAEKIGANLIILDDRDARQMALQRSLNVIGLLGVLGVDAQRKLITFSVAI